LLTVNCISSGKPAAALIKPQGPTLQATLLTTYLLAVGTLLAGACMTLWERKARPERQKVLGTWASAYVMLAAGCLIATKRQAFPGITGSMLSNLVIMAGYLLVLDGVASLDGRRFPKRSFALLAVLAAVWLLGGSSWQTAMWNYVTAFPIALVSAATGLEVMRSHTLRKLRSRRIVMTVMALYAAFYAGRAFALPYLVAVYGLPMLAMASNFTMYAGVLYSVFVPMALLALIREEAHERALQLALTDELTSLGNRRWFFEQGERLIDTTGRPLSLLAFDMDYFKTINDRHGHAMGDNVLKAFAQILHNLAAPGAILARIGGEEFAALLPNYNAAQARNFGLAVARRFAANTIVSLSGARVSATISVGIAERGAQETSLTDMLDIADRALYTAKSLGRNRVEIAAA
jgi:diguanylate cyclase (GGDEF)-like protein